MTQHEPGSATTTFQSLKQVARDGIRMILEDRSISLRTAEALRELDARIGRYWHADLDGEPPREGSPQPDTPPVPPPDTDTGRRWKP